MIKKALFAILVAGILVSCQRDLKPETIDVPETTVTDIPGTSDGTIQLALTGSSNLKDYIKVSYTMVGPDDSTEKGTFNNIPTRRSFELMEGSAKFAVFAEKVNDIPSAMYSSEDGFTLELSASVATPDGGKQFVLCGLKNAKVKNEEELLSKTVNAINEGLGDEMPGTGKKHFLRFDIADDGNGGLTVSTIFVSGNLID